LNADQIAAMQLRYYNSQVHEAAFVLPQFVVQVDESCGTDLKLCILGTRSMI
jgi:hypothetical protein